MHPVEARAQFAAQLQRDEADLVLDRAALLIAAESYASLDVQHYLAQLDEMAEQVRAHDEPEAAPVTRILRMNHVMFGELGFRGNTEDYFDARNSFLNEVLDRRKGIPITLSVVYLEIARRIGLPLVGVALPGHFIVKYQSEAEEILLDPFNEGRLLSEDDCFELLMQLYQGRIVFQRSLLAAVTKRQILARMLQNLKGIYARAQDHAKTLSVIERLLLVQPAPDELRDHGLVLAALQRIVPAIAELEHYLRQTPQADDAQEIRQKVKELRQKLAQLN